MEETMEQALENAETAESTGEAVSALADGIGTVFRDYLSEPLLKLLGVAAAVLDRKNEGALLSAFDGALSVLHACLLFVTVLYVLCVGIIIKVKAGV